MCEKRFGSISNWQTASCKALAIPMLAISGLLFSACQKEQLDASPIAVASQEPTMQRLLAMGFASQRIEDKGSYYLVEGDIRFDKQAAATAIPAKPGVTVKSQDQAHTYSLVEPSRQNILVGMDSSFPVQWQSVLQQVVSEWNNIPGKALKLSFVQSAASADIVFSLANLGGAYGMAEFPANGAPGYRVRIDPSTPSYLQHLVFAHELGHCFGLRHTNLYINGEGASNVGGIVIPETPREDPNSIMNSGDSPNHAQGWVGFSGYDVIAMQNLYPVFAPSSITNGYVKIVSKNSGQVLNVSGNSTEQNAQIVQWPYVAAGNDQWSIQDVGGGYYKIVARNSGQVLNVFDNSNAPGTRIIQWPYVAAGNDQWSIQDVGGGYYKIKSKNSGQVLNVEGNSNDPGTRIVQWPYVAAGNDQWAIQPI